MFSGSLLALVALTSFTLAQDAEDKTGWSGTLSSLDGGLGGEVRVIDRDTLQVSNYKLEDASAPGLYWWGSASDDVSDGFRISNTQVTEEATGETLIIQLDAGRTTNDFSTVSLWCEQFSLNFGQTTLQASGESSGDSEMTDEEGGEMSPAADDESSDDMSATSENGAMGRAVSLGSIIALALAATFAAWML